MTETYSRPWNIAPQTCEYTATPKDTAKTAYKAYVMCGTPVVGLEGISGCYALDRVKGA